MLLRQVASASRLSRSLTASTSTASSQRFASSLVFLEHKGGKLNDSSLSAVTAAQAIDSNASGIVIGSKKDVDGVLEQAKKISGLKTIYTASHDSFDHTLAETVAPFLAKFLPSKSITHLFAAHTAVGKNVFPRTAGILDTSMIADIIAVESDGNTFTRPIYAGNAILKLKCNDEIKVVTVRTTAFDKAKLEGSASVEEVQPQTEEAATKFVSEELTVSSRPDLSSAPRVVSGGRALKSKETFDEVMDPLADALGAAVGASRAAVDAGYADNSLQVGQTGKVVAPELYVAVGISGAIQHLAGMKESKMIVAINKDPDAPIFQVADAGLVADLFTAVPELVQKLPKANA
ncbi:hypothetical protein BD324DRAFT_635573 [Kockovaella imperatae]|uniref:Probable electron transfer flavoprotein subunit alpha n=1 Tax=Kockovaella imperatae TaxID=4999 RepID=A0A1Y1U8M0_9TREE|nr:hypothetical protein BD324DRAFT_635573 [Kockovaella imperatae]ORX34362.1 hypothetical protein BD324DRAFT_635573 [Kockovaella imperatae]